MGPLVEIGLKLLMKCLTEAVLGRVLIAGAWELAKKTQPTADDKIVKAIAEAWGVSTSDLAPVSVEPAKLEKGA